MVKLYENDPYLREFESVVISCEKGKKGYELVLEDTAFYPEGGGQPYDMGMIDSARVTEVHEKNGQVVHFVEEPFAPGQRVHGEINWQRRFDNMQNHSGEHVLSGLIHERFGYDNVGFHMGSDVITIDFNGIIEEEELQQLEAAANEIVYRNVPLEIRFPDSEELRAMEYRSKKALEGRIRIVTVPGADVCACCGTHVKRTGEIGIIKALGMIHYKGGVRISMLCGRRALELFELRQKQVCSIVNLLSAKPDGVTDAVERLLKECGEKDGRMNRLYQRMFEKLAADYPDSDERLCVFEPDLEPVQVRQLCNLLVENNKGAVVLACSGNDAEGYKYVIGSKTEDMRPESKRLNGLLNGRGGGSSQMAQGTFQAGRASIEHAFMQERD